MILWCIFWLPSTKRTSVLSYSSTASSYSGLWSSFFWWYLTGSGVIVSSSRFKKRFSGKIFGMLWWHLINSIEHSQTSRNASNQNLTVWHARAFLCWKTKQSTLEGRQALLLLHRIAGEGDNQMWESVIQRKRMCFSAPTPYLSCLLARIGLSTLRLANTGRPTGRDETGTLSHPVGTTLRTYGIVNEMLLWRGEALGRRARTRWRWSSE